MSMIALDTLKFSKKLIHAGVPRQQAEAQAEALAEIADEQLTTKHDLKELEIKLENKIDKIKHELLTKLGSLMVISIGTATTILGILISIYH